MDLRDMLVQQSWMRCERKLVRYLLPLTPFIRTVSSVSKARNGVKLFGLINVHTDLSRTEWSAMESPTETDSNSERTGVVKECGGKRKCLEPEEDDTRLGKKRKGNKRLKAGERFVPPPQKRNPGVSFNQEHFSETSYYFEGGLRKVYPYYFDFKTYCKGRWVGKTLMDVFSSEFRAEPIEYYKTAIKEGRIRLNETPVDDLSITLKV